MRQLRVRMSLPVVALVATILGGCCCPTRPPEGGKSASADCDYKQVDEPSGTRRFATIEAPDLSSSCLMLRDDGLKLLRAPLKAHAYDTACAVKIESIEKGDSKGDCVPSDAFAVGARFHISDWNGEKTLTIRYQGKTTQEVALHEGKVDGVAGVPWLYGRTPGGELHFFVYLENRMNDVSLNKVYRLEVFDAAKSDWGKCQTHLPTYQKKNVKEVNCDVPPPPFPGEEQSDTASGGEPPRNR